MTVVTANTGYDAYLLGMATHSVVGCVQLLQLPFLLEDSRDWAIRCCSKNIVTADLSDDDLDKNDTLALMFNLTEDDDVVAFELFKNNVKVADINNQTLGRYWDIGSITYYPDQDLMCGVELDWNAVLTAYGEGEYFIRSTINGMDYDTMPYTLIAYNIFKLDGTIKIESYMDGLILRKRMNYKGLNIRSTLRVKGCFGYIEKELTLENDLYSRYNANRRQLVQRKVNNVDIYNLELLPLHECMANEILDYHLFANEIYLSDYNANNYSYQYFRKMVFNEEAPELLYTKTSREVLIKAKLKEKIQDNEKRNYF